MDFYKDVPKDLIGNLKYRILVRKAARNDVKLQNALMAACRHDVLYFFNVFCWVYEPRPGFVDGAKMPHQLPFITWEHQDPAIRAIKDNLGFEDIGVEKSRGEGASWISVMLALHDFAFEPMTAIGLVSRTEAAVDNPEDPDSLMWKIDWELTKLPKWMRPPVKRNLQEHTLRNLINHSTITGYAATGDVASGGRKKWFLMDELAKFPRGSDQEAMASTQYVTNSRLVVSTPKGSEGAYYDLMHEPSSMVPVILDWKQNPTRNSGLYRFVDGRCVAVDPVNNPLPADYEAKSKDLFSRLRRKGFKLEGKERSPWYDHECDRPGATPHNIAQELDRDYGGSMYRIYGADFQKAAEADVRSPIVRGTLTYHPETLEPSFDTVDNGDVLLWTPLDAKSKPPRHPCVIGADICTGLGGSYTSNSVAAAIDTVTMEQVLEFSSNTIDPRDFADFCIALGKWLNDAYLIWEHNGPGAGFTKRILEQKYSNIYYRSVLWRHGAKKSKEPGWWTDDKTKEIMFGTLGRAVKNGELKLRSDALVKETGQYVRINGKIEHISAVNSKDDSSTGKAHGDRVVAIAVCYMGVKDRPNMKVQFESTSRDDPPPYTMAARQREWELSQKVSDEWDDRETSDFALHPGGMTYSEIGHRVIK